MGQTRDKVESILTTGIIGDPAVLQATVYGEGNMTETDVLKAALRIINSLSQALGVVADEVDDLRAATDGG